VQRSALAFSAAGVPKHFNRGGRSCGGVVVAAIVDPHRRRLRVAPAPEQIKCAIEDREVFAAMNEQRPARVVHLIARADVYVRKRLEDIEHAAHVDVEAGRAQEPPKHEQVLGEV
jgi:hypothetical protein